MGFCYSAHGLCCDFCNNDHIDSKWVKKIPCPYNWCQAWACCDKCFKKKLHLQSSCTFEKSSHKKICKRLSAHPDESHLVIKDVSTGEIKELSEVF